MNFLELEIAARIGQEVLKEVKKKFPDAGKPYNGRYKKHLKKYYKEFLLADCNYNKYDKDVDKELCIEYLHIEMFLNWLEKELKK